jgi:hypothetical protein
VFEKQNARDSQASEQAMMLAPIVQDRSLLFHREPNRIVDRTASTVMNRPTLRYKNDTPTPDPAAFAPVDVFGVHKKLFVQQAHRLKGFSSHHPKTADKNLDVQRSIMRKEKHMFSAE